MKLYTILLYLFLILISSCKQSDSEGIHSKEKSNQQKAISKNDAHETSEIDTVFLVNEKYSDSYFYKVYETREPSLYQYLDPEITDITFYAGGMQDSIKIQIAKNANIKYMGLPKRWSEVIYYNDKYYLYYPSDYCVLNQAQFKDGTFVDFVCEGQWAYAITKIDRTDKGNYEITLLGSNSNKPEFTISLVDEKSGVYQWERPHSKILMTHSENFQKLPIARADCGGNKCPDSIKFQAVKKDARQ